MRYGARHNGAQSVGLVVVELRLSNESVELDDVDRAAGPLLDLTDCHRGERELAGAVVGIAEEVRHGLVARRLEAHLRLGQCLRLTIEQRQVPADSHPATLRR